MKRSTRIGAALMGVAAVAAAAPAQSIGGGSEAMGGAGLAIRGNAGANPAHLGLWSIAGFAAPSIQYRAYGRDVGQASGYLARLRRKGLPNIELGAGSRTEDFGGSIGVAYGDLSLSYFARGSEQLLADGNKADLYGFGYEGYQLSLGRPVRTKKGELTVGANARFVQASYDHSWASRAGSGRAADASGRGSNAGFCLDLGANYCVDPAHETSYGIFIANLVSPRIGFDRQMPDGSFLRNAIQPFATTVNVGFATHLNDGSWVAVDGIDVMNQLDRRQLAVGFSKPLNRYLDLELGYNSRTSFVVGLSLLGIRARLAGRAPLTVESGFRF